MVAQGDLMACMVLQTVLLGAECAAAGLNAAAFCGSCDDVFVGTGGCLRWLSCSVAPAALLA
jgi:hypothetical protein